MNEEAVTAKKPSEKEIQRFLPIQKSQRMGSSNECISGNFIHFMEQYCTNE